MKTKSKDIYSETIKGFRLSLTTTVREDASFATKGTSFTIENARERRQQNKEKNKIRVKDNIWVHRNIPSSIAWHTEIHHDWANNGTMFLLSKGEHILRHRREKE